MSTLAINGGVPIHTTGWPDWPVCSDLEKEAVLKLLESGKWWQNSMTESILEIDNGIQPASEVGRFEVDFAALHGCRYGIATVNGSAALEVALRAAGIQPGDEVIVPPYTFIATAAAPLMIGAVPVFADILPETGNLDPQKMQRAIGRRTKAVIPVHFAGLSCEMNEIISIAGQYGLKVIEDCAHAHGAAYAGRMCGSIGDLGAFSFQGSKNITAGEGGIIITNRRDVAEWAKSYVWGGRGFGSGWYGHVNLASNLRLTEFQGAILSAQLKRLPEWFEHRARSAALLNDCLGALKGVQPMVSPGEGTTHAYHLFMFRYFPRQVGGLSKQRFVEALQAEGIAASVGYGYPLYQNPVFTQRNFWGHGYPFISGIHDEVIDYARFKETCPVSENACTNELVWLPQNCLLAEEEEIRHIAAAVEKVLNNYQELL